MSIRFLCKLVSIEYLEAVTHRCTEYMMTTILTRIYLRCDVKLVIKSKQCHLQATKNLYITLFMKVNIPYVILFLENNEMVYTVTNINECNHIYENSIFIRALCRRFAYQSSL